jgi:cytosine/adenosine deaminase-related metal-dependent hydrolase
VWLTEDDCALMAERGVTVSVNTSSNLRLRSGTAPVDRFVKHGLAFGLGLDGAAFDDDEDMLRELRLFWRMQRGLGPAEALARERLLRAVLVDGRSSIVGEDKGGRVEVGAPADLLLLDMTPVASDILPGRVDPLDLLLARGTNRLVRDLYVGGRRVVADGRCAGVDLAAAEEELTRQARTAAGAYDRGRQDRLTRAVANYYRCGCHLPGPLRATEAS